MSQNFPRRPRTNPFHFATITIAGAICVWAGQCPSLAWAQVRMTTRSGLQSTARFIEAPRSIQQEIREAERAIAEDRNSDAVVRLGDLLQRDQLNQAQTDLSGQDFFIPPPGNRVSRYSDSELHRARRMIGELPPSAIEIYELRYGPLARKTVNEAAAERDWNAVRDVRRKYFHTLAGYEASLLLAQQELLTGHPLAASLLLDEVVLSQRAVNHLGESIRLVHAAAMKLSGRELGDLTLPTTGNVRVGGSDSAWPEADERQEWLEKRFAYNRTGAGGQSRNYAMFGTSPNRNEGSAGQMPLANPRWKVETTSTPREARTIEKISADLNTAGQLPPPSLIPLRVGDFLLMRTTNRVFGVNYKTGKRIWNYPWYSIDESTEDDQAPPTVMGQAKGNSLLTQRVWNDMPYGQMTSDGQRVFFIDDLNEVEVVAFNPMGMRGTRPTNSGTNTLVALDLPTEGSLLWRLGEGADQASSLYDAFFLGPPLPLDGKLYVMVEVAGDILLVCLDPATGNEVWRQQLVAMETGAINVDAIRRISGATPTYSNGLLICPTGAGAVVAVDLVDRMLRWGVNYPRRLSLSNTMGSRSSQANPSRMMQRWHHGTAVTFDNSLLVTPTESDSIMCLDLLTGNKQFADRKRNDLRYLAGVRDGQAIFVGSRYVIAMDAKTGADVWRTDSNLLSTGQQISGRGVFGDGDYLLPTSSNELVRISLKDGSVLERRSVRYSLGNLVAVDGEVISQGAASLAVAYGERSLEPLVNAKLMENPDDFDALVRKSELLIQRGSRSEAMELLQRAQTIDAESVEVEMLLVSAMLGLLRDGDGDTDELVAKLNSLIDRPLQRVEFLSLQIQSALKNKKPENATQGLIQLSQLIDSTDQLDNSGKEVIDDPTRECSLSSWVAARMIEVKGMADEQQTLWINRQIREIAKRKVEGSKSALASVINHFAPFDVTTALTALGDKLLNDQAYLAMERSVLGSNTDYVQALKELSPPRLLLLAKAFAQGGMKRDAMRVIETLRADANEETTIDESEANESGSNKPAQKDIDAIESLAKTNLTKPVWDDQVGLDWQSPGGRGLGMPMSIRKQMRTEVIASETFRGWQLIAEGGNSLAMRNRTGRVIGMPTGRLGQPELGDRNARINGGMMLLIRGGDLTAVNLYKINGNQGADSEVWQRNFGGDGSSSTTRRSVPTKFGVSFYRHLISASRASAVPGEFRVGTMLGDRVFVLQGGDLMAIDLMTGKTLWRNSTAPPQGAVVSDGKRVAVVCKPLEKTVFYDVMDGRKLSEQAWKHGEVWAESGQNLLCFSETDDRWKYNLRLVNPFTQKVLLETVSVSSNRGGEGEERAFGKLVSDRFMLLLNTKGDLKIWDLFQGNELVDANIGEYTDLKAVHGMELDGQLIVCPERLDSMIAAVDGEDSRTEEGQYHKTADAMFAYSLEDGKERWQNEFDSPWGCTLAQPADTPMILLTRLRWRIAGNSEKKMKMDALAIDVRDGKTLHQRRGQAVSSRMNQQQAKIVVQHVQDRVVAQIGGEILSYKFGAIDQTDDENNSQSKGGDDDLGDGGEDAASLEDGLGDLFGE